MAENCKYCKHYSDNSKICVISKPCINQNMFKPKYDLVNYGGLGVLVEKEKTILDIATEIGQLVEKKDKDYNSAFSKTLKEYGDVAYFLRIDDKLNRLKSLLLCSKDAEINESVEDTLKDIVGYTLLMLKEKRA